MTGFKSKRQAAQAKLNDDDDTQVYADTLLIVYQRGFSDGKKAAQRKPCIGKDPRCPCQDGDACHYKDCGNTKALPVPPAQPEQEPVATLFGSLPVYDTAAQRQWVGLEAEEVLDLFDVNNVYGSKWIEFARTVEAKLRSKNGH
jgi:hypothetical protein